MKKLLISLIAVVFFNTLVLGQEEKGKIVKDLDVRQKEYAQVAMQIWNWAEVGYQEERSSLLLQKVLADEGFKIEAGVAGMPTAFTASYGKGKPVITIFAEYDALPGVSQEAVPYKKPIENLGAGHACGHHLFRDRISSSGRSCQGLAEKERVRRDYSRIRNPRRRRGCRKSVYGAWRTF